MELERSAGRAQARGGLAAAAAFLRRAVALTNDPARRADRALTVAQASLKAGEFDEALALAATAEAGPPDEFQRARVDLLRANVAFISFLGSDASALLLKAARRLEPFDLELARDTYLTALGAALLAAHAPGEGVLLEICRAVRALPPPGAPRPLDLLLDGLALLTTEGQAAATPTLQRAARALADIPVKEAESAARQATSDPRNWWSMCAAELVEAAVRGGEAELARDALERLAKTTQPCHTEFALGIEARCRALLSDEAAADELYREAIERLRRTRLRPELARAHLLYGAWLRRENRRVDAREQLRTAHEMLAAIGMEAFAERARQELQATGEKVRKRTVGTRDDLTAQERQIARLARGGLSNPEIGARLFLSARTVEWHLRNVFTKLGIRSRRELANALPGPDSLLAPA